MLSITVIALTWEDNFMKTNIFNFAWNITTVPKTQRANEISTAVNLMSASLTVKFGAKIYFLLAKFENTACN